MKKRIFLCVVLWSFICLGIPLSLSGCGSVQQCMNNGDCDTTQKCLSGLCQPLSNEKCTYNGKSYTEKDSFKSKDGCNTCSCKGGLVVCTKKACAEQKCGSRGMKPCPTGQYCDQPKHCGSTDIAGTCKAKPENCTGQVDSVCGCDGKTYSNACVAASAGVAVKSKGKCSTESKDCKEPSSGKTYKNGDTVPSTDPCKACTCENGAIKCVATPCNNKSCKYNNKTHAHNSSFPAIDGCNTCSCDNGSVVCSKKPCAQTCTYEGKTYKEGASFPSKDGCNKCSCTKGKVVCTDKACPKKNCNYNGKEQKHGTSFPATDGCNTCLCEDGKVSCTEKACPGTCKYNGQTYKDGASFPSTDGCNTCGCSKGNVVCTKKACPGTCKYNGQTYKDGASFPSTDGCNTCGCSKGNVVCTKKACPGTCKYNGQTYKDGASFPSTDGCNKCSCSKGSVVCTKKACPPGSCQSNTDCKSSEYCALPSGQCSGTGKCTTKPTTCTQIFAQVCGCDNVTYSNDCMARSKGANVASKGACKKLTCSERVSKAKAAVSAEIRKHLSCTLNSECTSVPTSTNCQGACSEGVNTKGKASVTAVISTINQTVCKDYRKDGCPYATPRCMARSSVCHTNKCMLLSCNERVTKSNDALETVRKKYLSCTQDTDCTLFWRGTKCRGACQGAVNKRGESAVKAMISSINNGICQTYQKDQCPFMTPSCRPGKAKCSKNVCIVDYSAP